MAIVKTILFLEDQLHASVDASEIEAVGSTAEGHKDNIRDANYLTWWKGNDDLVTNLQARADFTAGTNIAAATQTVYACVAYDPREIDQTTIIVQYDSADDPSFAGATGAATITIDTTDTLPTCQWVSFAMPNPAKRYWRLMQRFADRGGAGRTIPIFYWGMYGPTHVCIPDTEGNKPGPGPGGYGLLGSAGLAIGPGGQAVSNATGYSQQRFDVTLTPANTVLFEKIRDGLITGDVMGRAIFVQHEGLRNEAQANFQLCRVDVDRWEAVRAKMEKYEIVLPLVTEAFI